MNPDLVWYRGGEALAVIDAKYKAEKVAGYPNADLYQMLAYCTALGLPAGHLVYLEARHETPTGAVLAGLVLYRHGGRLSTVHSGDHDATRATNPGALHLLRWRAIQLAVREGAPEMDLGGVDVAGARREPVEGEPMYGLYQHKRSFGGQWVELTGAHERVADARGYALGRVAMRLQRVLRR